MQRGPSEPQGLLAAEAIYGDSISDVESYGFGGLKEDLEATRAVEGRSDWRRRDNVGVIARRARAAS